MLQRTKALLAVVILTALATAFWGCDRLKNEVDPNQNPEVFFVNVPFDSTVFNYAPIVHWIGTDPDGLISAYLYIDDSSRAAVQAYRDGDAEFNAYVAGLPASAWTTTYMTSDTILLRRGETDSTEQIFMVRAVDNEGALSPVKVRTFFRTNQPPDPPLVKWALDALVLDSTGGSSPIEYQTQYIIPDTLFWSDTLNSTYPGIGFLWKGTDPDSRELNIIRLEYSWVLVNESEQDTFPYPIMDDSNRVVGYGQGWSPWSDQTQMFFSASNVLRSRPDFVLDGHYRFLLRVRDDGLTQATSIASAEFDAVAAVSRAEAGDRANFEHQLLVVDWNSPQTTYTNNLGQRPDAEIVSFYQQAIPEGLALAEQYRQAYYNYPQFPDNYIQDAIDPNDVAWYTTNKIITDPGRVPYDYIRHFKWVLVISENPPQTPPDVWESLDPKLKGLMRYMDAGGQVMLVGRRLFYGTVNVGQSGLVAPGPFSLRENFLRNYFNMYSVGVKKFAGSEAGAIGDFAGAKSTSPYMPNFDTDTTIVRQMRWGTKRFTWLPEIDYFGRSGSGSGYDVSTTLYNYFSSTSLQPYEATNIDCRVLRFDTLRSIIYLQPATGHNRILDVTRIHNVTKNVDAEFILAERNPPVTGPWRILASVPSNSPVWVDTDLLEVDYTYIPISASHDQPVASNFNRIQGVVRYNPNTGTYLFVGETRFRAALFAFPLSFMKNEPYENALLPGVTNTPAADVIANEAIFFNFPRFIRVGNGE